MSQPKWTCRNCGQSSNSDVIDVNEGVCMAHPAGSGNHSWERYTPEVPTVERGAEIHYLLVDDGGLNDLHLPILLAEGSMFRHEYGLYKVLQYINEGDDGADHFQVHCEREAANV